MIEIKLTHSHNLPLQAIQNAISEQLADVGIVIFDQIDEDDRDLFPDSGMFIVLESYPKSVSEELILHKIDQALNSIV